MSRKADGLVQNLWSIAGILRKATEPVYNVIYRACLVYYSGTCTEFIESDHDVVKSSHLL